MGGASSTPAAAPEGDGSEPRQRTWTAGASERQVHGEAMGWVKMHLCRPHLEALHQCSQTAGADCDALREAVVRCKAESEEAAWRQLQQNAMVQCGAKYKAFGECMGGVQRGEGEAPATEEERAKCKPLWMAMQYCAAEHVVRHVAAQHERTDGKFVPPPSERHRRTFELARERMCLMCPGPTISHRCGSVHDPQDAAKTSRVMPTQADSTGSLVRAV